MLNKSSISWLRNNLKSGAKKDVRLDYNICIVSWSKSWLEDHFYQPCLAYGLIIVYMSVLSGSPWKAFASQFLKDFLH